MQRERARVLGSILLACDIAGLFLAFCAAYYLKQLMPEPYGYVAPLTFYGWMVLIYILTLVASLFLLGRYSAPLKHELIDEAITSLKGVVIATAVTIIALFVTKERLVSRLLVGFYSITSFVYLVASWTVFWQIARRSKAQLQALVVGVDHRAEALASELKKDPHTKVGIAGFLKLSENEQPSSEEMRVLGTVADLEDILDRGGIDDVFFAVPMEKIARLSPYIYTCEEVGVRAHVMWDMHKPKIAKIVTNQIGELPILSFTPTPTKIGALLFKYVMDRVLAFVLIVVLSPLLLAIAVAIKATSRGPVIFKQIRSGLNGRPFVMYKFRTMVQEAEKMKPELIPLNEMDGPVFKLKDDPRVTRLGRFLRRTSLDELPQLFNVLKGDMSLVGPRPLPTEEVEKFDRWQRRRQSMKPGMTCIWQISGRNEIDFEDWMKMDLQYIDNWSLGLDIAIILKTIPAVISGRGAS